MPIVGFEPADPRGKQVLIVDDDNDIRQLVEVIIKGAGFSVLTAATGEEAINKMVENPDMLVLDLIMPGCGGLGVLDYLRDSGVPPPPIVVLTAYENRHPAVSKAIQDPNVALCLGKPIDSEKLVGALHRCLKTEPLKDENRQDG